MAEYTDSGDFAPATGGGSQSSDRTQPTPDPNGPPDPWAIPYLPPDQGGSNTGGDKTNKDATDWSSLLGIYGMPPDVSAAVGKIFADNPDVSQAIALALAYIRGTDWYKATYPGIQAGMQNGLIHNEADYRAYVNNITQYYKQYLGRAPTADEISAYMANGTDPSIVGKTLEGNAYAATYKSDIEFYAGNFGTGQVSQDDLNAYGQEKVGLGSDTGYAIDKMVTQAIQRYQGAFGGTAATASGTTIGPVGLAATGLAGQRESLSNSPDVGAA